MDPIKQDLDDKLAQASLSPRQVQEGITACFILTNRQFLRRRLGDDRPVAEIDATTKDLVHQVFADVGVSATEPSLSGLRMAWHTLDEQLGFEADPELSTLHWEIIERLFELAESNE